MTVKVSRIVREVSNNARCSRDMKMTVVSGMSPFSTAAIRSAFAAWNVTFYRECHVRGPGFTARDASMFVPLAPNADRPISRPRGDVGGGALNDLPRHSNRIRGSPL